MLGVARNFEFEIRAATRLARAAPRSKGPIPCHMAPFEYGGAGMKPRAKKRFFKEEMDRIEGTRKPVAKLWVSGLTWAALLHFGTQ